MNHNEIIKNLGQAVAISRRELEVTVTPATRDHLTDLTKTLEGALDVAKNRTSMIRRSDYVPPVKKAMVIVEKLGSSKDVVKLTAALQRTLDIPK
jgi:hypothetical protein